MEKFQVSETKAEIIQKTLDAVERCMLELIGDSDSMTLPRVVFQIRERPDYIRIRQADISIIFMVGY